MLVLVVDLFLIFNFNPILIKPFACKRCADYQPWGVDPCKLVHTGRGGESSF